MLYNPDKHWKCSIDIKSITLTNAQAHLEFDVQYSFFGQIVPQNVIRFSKNDFKLHKQFNDQLVYKTENKL